MLCEKAGYEQQKASDISKLYYVFLVAFWTESNKMELQIV